MRSLRTQLSLTISLVVLVTVLLISMLSNQLINKQFETYILDEQHAKIAAIVQNISMQYRFLTNSWGEESLHALGMHSLYEGYVIKVYDNKGEMVWDAENHDMSLCQQIMDDIYARMKAYGATGDFVLVEHPLIKNGQQVGTMSIRYYGPYFLQERDFAFLDSLNVVLLIIGALSLLLSFVAGWFLARRIARPIIKTADIAKHIASGNYRIQFEGQTKMQELDNLILAINHLATALDKQESLRKQLTADVAHELRTPLAMLSSHLELMTENIWEPTQERLKNCHDEILRLGKTVADLESLERTEREDLRLEKTPVDLLCLAYSVCGNFEQGLAIKQLALEVTGKPTTVLVDKDRVVGAVTNLLSNAVKYTPSGGYIHVHVEDAEDFGTIVVEDNGIGIPENDLPFVFERFYRADKSRYRGTGGAGIGLAIVKSIAAAHGGSITVQSTIDVGSRFVLTLPKNEL